MVIPLIAGAVRMAPAIISRAKPLLTGIKKSRLLNSEFVKDYGKQLAKKSYKKYEKKIIGNPREAISKFKEDFSHKINDRFDSLSSEAVKFDLGGNGTEQESVAPLENETKETETFKKPSKFFNGVEGLSSFIKDGRTFGSISLLLFVILFIVFAIRPVGNTTETRLTLMFKTLLGLTELKGMAEKEDLEADEGKGFVEDYINAVQEFSSSKAVDYAGNFSPQLQAGSTLLNGISKFVNNIKEDVSNFEPKNSFQNIDGLSGIGDRGYGGINR
jgi:hypothetical protein